MEVEVQSASAGLAGRLELDDRVFGLEPNRALLHQVTVAQLANRRQGTADTRTRGEVAGSTRKMWRQKGTGRARQGARTAPHWRGGGVVFGPHPRSYRQRLPKKMRRSALRAALSDRVAVGALHVVEAVEVPDGRTKSLRELLAGLGATGKTLLVLGAPDVLVRRAAGNLPDVFVALPHTFSVLEVLQADTVILTRDAVGHIADLLAPTPPPPSTDAAEVPPAALPRPRRRVAAEPSASAGAPEAGETAPAPSGRPRRRAAAAPSASADAPEAAGAPPGPAEGPPAERGNAAPGEPHEAGDAS